MFEFTKSERPYMWQIHAWGTIFHKSWNKKSDNMCEVIRRLILGVIFILLAPFVGALAICALFELPIQFLHGYYDYVFHPVSHVIGVVVYAICGIVIAAIAVISALFGLGYLLFDEDALHLGHKIKETVVPEEGFISTWYDGFKQKYCPSVVMRDKPYVPEPETDEPVYSEEQIEAAVEEEPEDEGPLVYSTVVITCRVDESTMGEDFETDLQTDVEDLLEDNWMDLELISAEITERGQTDEEAEPTEEIDELVEDNDD